MIRIGLVGLEYDKIDAFTVEGETLVRVPAPNYGAVLVSYRAGKRIATFAMQNVIGDGVVDSKVWANGSLNADIRSNEESGARLSRLSWRLTSRNSHSASATASRPGR